MASISLSNASVEIPVFAVGNNSLKTTLLRKAVGGKFGQAGNNLIINALNNVSIEVRDGERVGMVSRRSQRGKPGRAVAVLAVAPPAPCPP
jgi:ABC-2 type transport system ATP-binding protein